MAEKATIKNLDDVLTEDEELWYKKRVKTESLVGHTLILTKADYRQSTSSSYYILHWTNEETDGMVTSTCGGTVLMKKCAALLNRDAFPIRCKVVVAGNSYDIVAPDKKEA